MPESAPIKMEGFADGITMAQKIEKWLEWSKTQEKPIPITKDVAKNLSVAGQKLKESEDTVGELFSKGREKSETTQTNSGKDGADGTSDSSGSTGSSGTPDTAETTPDTSDTA
ncbi:MAG: hypothetical protein VXX46_02620, partial [Bacteroidota bacterium]|nr:hypothetical protein [Bacteroidota bacterium]